jgi:hypothetical protein
MLLEHAWTFARLQYGEGSKRAERWVHQLAQDLRAGKVQAVIRRLQRLTPSNEEASQCLKELISYYRDNAQRMQCEEYLRLGCGIGSGAVESAHKQVVHALERSGGPPPTRSTAAVVEQSVGHARSAPHGIVGPKRPSATCLRIQIYEPGLIGHPEQAEAG